MIDQLKPLIGKLCSFSQKRLGFSNPPKLFLKNDSINSQKPLGKTAYYNPNDKSITLFVHGRHPKDILRSFAHELVHHTQNLRGDLSPDKCGDMGDKYAQENDHMRNMEKEAYLKGNMCLRDWEDGLSHKDKILYKITESIFTKENKKVNAKKLTEIIRQVVKTRLMEGPKPKPGPSSEKFKSAQQNLDMYKAMRDAAPEDQKGTSLENYVATLLNDPRRKAELQAFNDALTIVKSAQSLDVSNEFAFSADPEVNKQANLAYRSLHGGPNKRSIQQLESMAAQLLDSAIKRGVTGDLARGLDTTNAENNGAILNAQKAAGISAAVSTFTRSGDKIMTAVEVKLKGAVPDQAPPAPETPATPDVDGAIASSEPTLGPVGGGSPQVASTPAAAAGSGDANEVRKKKGQQNRIVRRGDLRGIGINNIKDLQQRLVESRYSEAAGATRDGSLPNGRPFVDGDFGQTTQNAVKKLQADLGLGRNADGVIGRNTLRRIMASNIANVQVFREGPDAQGAQGQPSPISIVQKQTIGENKTMTTKITKSFLTKTIKNLLKEAIEIDETQCSKREDGAAQPPPHPYDTEGSAAPVQDVLKMISDISSDGKITGEELVAAGEELMKRSKGSSYRDSQEFRDDYAANQDQLDDLAAYQNMEEGSEDLQEKKCPACKGKGCPKCEVKEDTSKLNPGLRAHIEKKKKKDKKEPAGMTDPDAPMSVPADDNDPPAKEGEKPDFADIDGDGNENESAKGAAKDKKKKKKTDESKIQTPEQENALYEQRFAPKNNRLFEKLVKEWTK